MTPLPQQHHLDLLHHLGGVLSHSASIQSAVAVNLPKQATTDHFATDGKTPKSHTATSFANLHSKDGKIVGGQLNSKSQHPNGAPLHNTNMSFGAHGAPTAAGITVMNRFTTGVFHTIGIDFGAIVWTPGFNVDSGHLSISTKTLAGVTKSQGQLAFAGERPCSAEFTYFHPGGSGQISGHTSVNYQNTNFSGQRITGGKCTIVSKLPNGKVRASSDVQFTPKGLLRQVVTLIHDPSTGTLLKTVTSDFSKTLFTPMRKIDSGTISYDTAGSKGVTHSKSIVTFANEKPVKSVTAKYILQQLDKTISIDFSTASFNNQLRVISSATQLEVRDNLDQIIIKGEVQYDAQGNKAQTTTESLSPTTQKVVARTVSDFSQVSNDYFFRPVAGTVRIEQEKAGCGKPEVKHREYGKQTSDPSDKPIPPFSFLRLPEAGTVKPQGQISEHALAAPNGTKIQVKNVYRPNGKLLSRTETTTQNSKPISAIVTQYATDGTTITGIKQLSLQALGFDPGTNQVSGQLSIHALTDMHQLKSKSQVTF